MLAQPGRRAWLAALLTIAIAASASASDRSQVLVAKGEVAYHAGRLDEARSLFEQAVQEDAKDVDARYALGLTFSRLGRWEEAAGSFQQALTIDPANVQARRALEVAEQGGGGEIETGAGAAVETPEAKAWEIHASTGVQYDSNVVLAPRGHTRGAVNDRGDVAFIISGGGRYDILNTSRWLARLEYDLYQTLHPNIDDFDFRSHRPRGTLSYALRPDLWLGAQTGYNHYTLGSDSYEGEYFAMPFLSLLEGAWGMSQLTYRYGDGTYFSPPFDDLRDGHTHAIGPSQTFYFDGGARYLTLGYQFDVENPRASVGPANPAGIVGNDFEMHAQQGYVGLGFPAWWQTTVDLMYLYRYDDYDDKNSQAGFRRSRADNEHHMYASVRKPINQYLSFALAYYGTVNTSNIAIFDYRRNVVAGVLQVSY
jgi:tetratricopeptide (TPR) repeat protein